MDSPEIKTPLPGGLSPGAHFMAFVIFSVSCDTAVGKAGMVKNFCLPGFGQN
jgi:hypothetical protein